MKARFEASDSTYHDQIVGQIEEFATKCELDHRFLGGLPSTALSSETKLLITASQRIAQVFNSPIRSLVRSNGTIKDLDALYFNPDKTAYNEFLKLIQLAKKRARSQDQNYPVISFERARWPEDYPNRFFQFVSSVEVENSGSLALAYGETRQIIPATTFSKWKLVFDGGLEISTIHPAALPERYLMRTGSGNVKLKDQGKYNAMRQKAMDVIKQCLEQGFDYDLDFKTWGEFIDKLRYHPDRLTKAKGWLADTYWKTIGTGLSQGIGAELGNKFTG